MRKRPEGQRGEEWLGRRKSDRDRLSSPFLFSALCPSTPATHTMASASPGVVYLPRLRMRADLASVRGRRGKGEEGGGVNQRVSQG